jgi:type IX secretion system PorP/SprF family membrane protein
MSEYRKIRYLFFLLVFLLPVFQTGGQDITFSQFYSNPLYLNPAFAGSLNVPRLAVQHRNQWPAFGDAFKTTTAAFDFPVRKLQGGLGFYLLNDEQAAGSYRSLQFNAVYSVYIQLSQDYRLHGAVQATLGQNSLNMDKPGISGQC